MNYEHEDFILTRKLNEKEVLRVAEALRANGVFVMECQIDHIDSIINIVRFFGARTPKERSRICDIICDAIGEDRVPLDFWELRLTENQAYLASYEIRYKICEVSLTSLKISYVSEILGNLKLEYRKPVYAAIKKAIQRIQ